MGERVLRGRSKKQAIDSGINGLKGKPACSVRIGPRPCSAGKRKLGRLAEGWLPASREAVAPSQQTNEMPLGLFPPARAVTRLRWRAPRRATLLSTPRSAVHRMIKVPETWLPTNLQSESCKLPSRAPSHTQQPRPGIKSKVSTTALHELRALLAVAMGTVNYRHHDNLQDGSGDSVQRFPHLAGRHSNWTP